MPWRSSASARTPRAATAQDARDYAFTPGGHLDAMRRDRARGHHKTEYCVRLRPLVERGSLVGTTPLGAVLSQQVAAG
jgi:hypothetical protein